MRWSTRVRQTAARRARRTAAIIAARCASLACRAVGRHGTALPGLVAERIDPEILAELGRRVGPVVLVTGTNGKTTTTRLLARILERATGSPPVSNRSGANLSRGIVNSLLAVRSEPRGTRPAVFEVDELALPHVAAQLRPDVVVILNLVRDQLDRYGEVDAVERRWLDAFSGSAARPQVVVCADDPRLESIAAHLGPAVHRFGLERRPGEPNGADDAADELPGVGLPAPCPRCGGPTDVDDASATGGAWRCPACGDHRAALDLGVRLGDEQDRWLRLAFRLRAGRRPMAGVPLAAHGGQLGTARVRLTGTAGAHDAAAAVLAAITLGFEPMAVVRAIDGATPAFGRLEELSVGGREVILSLAKNPASAAQAAEAAAVRKPDRLLIGLGDRPADGRDVSWIWDARLDALAAIAPMSFTGERADDLALRFKYGVAAATQAADTCDVEPELERALRDAIARVRPGGTLMVLGTYTTLLGMRHLLERRGQATAMPR